MRPQYETLTNARRMEMRRTPFRISNFPVLTCTRGLDFRGDLGGAGGVGGLLARTVNAQLMASDASTAHAYSHADGNGNVTALINARQIIVALYLYDPYGNTLARSGSLGEANTVCFSSKEWQENTASVTMAFGSTIRISNVG
jgi:hypothetical protein